MGQAHLAACTGGGAGERGGVLRHEHRGLPHGEQHQDGRQPPGLFF